MNLIDKDAFSNEMKKRQDACSEWVKEAKGNYRYRALGAWSILSEVKLTLDKMPTIDAVDVVHGEWIAVHDWLQIPQEERGTYRCSACGQVMKYPWNYCPNCGARMDGEVKNNAE